MNPTFTSHSSSPFSRHRAAAPTITFPATVALAKPVRAGFLGRLLTALGLALDGHLLRPRRGFFV